MRLSVAVAVAVAVTAVATGCGPAPGREPRVPAGGIRVVPAAQVVGSCQCDDDEYATDDATPPRPATQYVKLTDWQPPAQVAEVEASVPPRGAAPLTTATYPALTLHRPIDETKIRVFRHSHRH